MAEYIAQEVPNVSELTYVGPTIVAGQKYTGTGFNGISLAVGQSIYIQVRVPNAGRTGAVKKVTVNPGSSWPGFEAKTNNIGATIRRGSDSVTGTIVGLLWKNTSAPMTVPLAGLMNNLIIEVELEAIVEPPAKVTSIIDGTVPFTGIIPANTAVKLPASFLAPVEIDEMGVRLLDIYASPSTLTNAATYTVSPIPVEGVVLSHGESYDQWVWLVNESPVPANITTPVFVSQTMVTMADENEGDGHWLHAYSSSIRSYDGRAVYRSGKPAFGGIAPDAVTFVHVAGPYVEGETFTYNPATGEMRFLPPVGLADLGEDPSATVTVTAVAAFDDGCHFPLAFAGFQTSGETIAERVSKHLDALGHRVDAPAIQAPGFGLLSTAQTVTDMDEHWLNGVHYREDGTSRATTHTDIYGTPPTDVMEDLRFGNAAPVMVRVVVDVSTVGADEEGVRDLCAQHLDQAAPRVLEAALWSGVDTDGNPLKRHLSDTDDAWPAPFPETDLASAIGRLEAAMGDRYAGTPVLHVPRQYAAIMEADTLVKTQGAVKVTALGSKVAFGTGYVSGTPRIVATTAVAVRRQMADFLSEPMIDREQNRTTVVAERAYLVHFEGTPLSVAIGEV
jgi:hypothetical protein